MSSFTSEPSKSDVGQPASGIPTVKCPLASGITARSAVVQTAAPFFLKENFKSCSPVRGASFFRREPAKERDAARGGGAARAMSGPIQEPSAPQASERRSVAGEIETRVFFIGTC